MGYFKDKSIDHVTRFEDAWERFRQCAIRHHVRTGNGKIGTRLYGKGLMHLTGVRNV